jgi:protocatechuate 3,4-dioxygenase alpha subunit
MSKIDKLTQTPSQTVGPYFAYSLAPKQYVYPFNSMVGNHQDTDQADLVTITGQIFDGNGICIPDALIEIWSSDPEDVFFGRYGTGTDVDGKYYFQVRKPSPVGQAPHLLVIIMMRGQLIHSYTRIYFDDEVDKNLEDKIFNLTPESRRHTLLAKKIGDKKYNFNIYMQGENETVFFDA